MSEPTPPPASATSPAAPTPASGNTWKYTLGLILLLVAAAGGYYFYERARNPDPPPVDELKGLEEYLTRLAASQKLAAEYSDAGPKDLVADTPTDPSKFAFTPGTPGAAQGKVKFAAVGYEKDWEYVRKIEDTLSRLLDGQ